MSRHHRAPAALIGTLLAAWVGLGSWATALEMHPPWIHDQPKPKSPYNPPWLNDDDPPKDGAPYHPPWVGREKCKDNSPDFPPWLGTECHQHDGIRGGVWTVPLDWRDVDWRQADSGAGLHMRTQAFSLWVESKLCPNKPRKYQDPILEYFPDPSPTGPGRVVK